MTKWLPKTNKRTLVATLVVMSACGGYVALLGLFMFFQSGNFFPLILAAFYTFIAVGLWRLSSAARITTLVFLWMMFAASVFMPWNPIYYLEFREKHHFIPTRFEVGLQYWAIASVCLLFIFLLMKYKEEFQNRSKQALRQIG